MSGLRLGKVQCKWAAWALDPMGDLWCTDSGAHERGGAVFGEELLPFLNGNLLVIGHVPEPILTDLIYRLESQAPGLAEQEGDDPRPPIRLADRIADKTEGENQ